jgi:chloramphenicol-sensitive protein RarD
MTGRDPDGHARAAAERVRGLALAGGAYGLWGLVPIYFKSVAHVSSLEVLAWRSCWSLLILAGLVSLRRRWADVRASWVNRRTRATLLVTSVLIAGNWLLYIHAVGSGQVLMASLGYFMAPLVYVMLGFLFLGERLRTTQWVAIGLISLCCVWLATSAGEFPWISLGLAVSFGLYALLRKRVAADGLIGLTFETSVLGPLGLAWILMELAGITRVLPGVTFGSVSRSTDLLLIAGGVVTTVPLILFAEGARRLPLSVLGMVQYFSPSLQFLLGHFLYHEPLDRNRLIAFGVVWLAIALFTIDGLKTRERSVGPAGAK